MKEITIIEIKAKCKDPDKLHSKLMELNADFKGMDHQVDTYFNCDNGRLKLRRGNIENTLIFYNRENSATSKESQVTLQRLSAENNMKEILMKSYGIFKEVDKERNIYFIKNVKFHIDNVKNLGSFMEIEAIDETGSIGKEQLQEQCDFYIRELSIQKEDMVKYSYSDLV